MKGLREIETERKATGEKQDTTATVPAVDGLEEMTVKIGKTADPDVTTIKRKQTESREEMETKRDQDGTGNLKSKT